MGALVFGCLSLSAGPALAAGGANPKASCVETVASRQEVKGASAATWFSTVLPGFVANLAHDFQHQETTGGMNLQAIYCVPLPS